MRTASPFATLSSLPLVLLALSTPARGQFGGGGLGDTPPTDFPWETTTHVPSSVAELDAIRMRAGDPDGDLRPDVFVRGAPAPSGATGSHEIVFLFAPWAGSASAKLAQTANDFDVLPGTAAAPATKLAIVGSTGLHLVAWDPLQTPPFGATLVTSDSAWLGATFVRCAELDGSPGTDYVGVASDRRTVLLRSSTGTNWPGFVSAADIVAVEPLQWIAGGAQEFAVLTENGMRVHHGDGTLIDNFNLPSPRESTIAVVRYGASGPDRVAWACALSPGQPWAFQVYRSASPQTEPLIVLPFAGVAGMATADMDRDGDWDLVVASRETSTLRVYSHGDADGYLRAYAATRSQAVTDASLTPPGVLPYDGAPVFADLGNDGRADLLVPVQFEVDFEGEPVLVSRFEALRSRLPSSSSSEDVLAAIGRLEFEDIGTEARVAFHMNTLDFHVDATHLQVLPWTQADAQSYLDQHSDGPVRRFPIDGAQFPTADSTWGVELEVSLPGTVCEMPIRWFEVRLVEVDDDVVVRAWPTYVFAVIADPDNFCPLDVANNVERELEPSPHCGLPPSCQSGGEGNWPSAAITRRRKADPPPGIVPIVPVEPLILGEVPMHF